MLKAPWTLAFLPLLAAGCMSPEEYKAEADEEVYALVDARREALFRREPGFNIEASPGSLRQRILDGELEAVEGLGLVDALEIAAENSRDFQTRKESLYRAALDLTLEKWRFSNNWSLGGDAGLNGTADEADTAEVEGDLGMSRLLGTGANIVGAIGASLLRFVNTGDGWDAVTDISLSVTQPLLRGAARTVVLEPLTQSERNLVYEVRSFERFRRTFAVDVVSNYYDILVTMDRIQNEEANLERVRLTYKRQQSTFEAGRGLAIDVDEAQQQLLSSENRLIDLRASLGRQLDTFKISLGLPVSLPLSLSREELETLRQVRSEDVLDLDPEKVVELGLERRLDLLNTRDSVVDAARRVVITEDALRAGLDLSASVSTSSQDGQPVSFRSEDIPWSIGLSLDLPIDNLPDRNVYRRALIDLESRRRSAEQEADSVARDLLAGVREARSTRGYEIQLLSVELNQRRLESAELGYQAGRVDPFDLLRAQADLLSAQNSASSSLVNFALARLGVYRDLELLELTPEGILVDSSALPRLPAEPASADEPTGDAAEETEE